MDSERAWTDVFDGMQTDIESRTVSEDSDRIITEVLHKRARTRTTSVVAKDGGDSWRREQRTVRARTALQAAKEDVDLANAIIGRLALMDASTATEDLVQQVLRLARVVKRSVVGNRRALVLLLDVEDDADNE